ncbi:lysophospholipid acyltransferase family protein [Salinisphaera sp. SPP-AMP-43]|uniref:lysophospholipid acyltransferase family protein n=1 Tax=Salinisphaera sp. SPP-AMP-43 TaxID=3121288 RepID=UPI003C6E3331
MSTTSSFATDHPLLGRVALGFKAVRFACVLLLGVLLLPAVPLLGRRSKYLINWWLGRMLNALHVRVDIDGNVPSGPMLVVANHCSWLDILVLGRVFNTAFVSKAEVGRWPLVGSFARAGGTLFLDRGQGKTGETSTSIQDMLASGRSVLFFPEGTTTPDPNPRRFHARLFAAAIDGGYNVLPVSLRYCDDTTPPGMHHALAPWVNEAALWPHFRDLFKLREIHAEIRVCAALDPRGYDRRSLAEAARMAVAHRQAVAASRGVRGRTAGAE